MEGGREGGGEDGEGGKKAGFYDLSGLTLFELSRAMMKKQINTQKTNTSQAYQALQQQS